MSGAGDTQIKGRKWPYSLCQARLGADSSWVTLGSRLLRKRVAHISCSLQPHLAVFIRGLLEGEHTRTVYSAFPHMLNFHNCSTGKSFLGLKNVNFQVTSGKVGGEGSWRVSFDAK